jgi:hypothetical protein
MYLNMAYLEMTLSWVCNVKPFGTILPNTIFLVSSNATATKLKQFDETLNVAVAGVERGDEKTTFGTFPYYRIILNRLQFQAQLLEVSAPVHIVRRGALRRWYSLRIPGIPRYIQVWS